jgi:hypothetical protein
MTNVTDQSSQLRLRVYLTALVVVAEMAHLMWEHVHGGIQNHHFLNRADMPASSNAWGLLLLPMLSWLLSGFALKRARVDAATGKSLRLPVSLIVGFFAALVFGALLAASFTLGYHYVSSAMFQGLLVLALVFPLYRGECVLGFILGLTFIFGAVLPTIIASVVATLSALAHLVVYPLVVRLWTWLRRS